MVTQLCLKHGVEEPEGQAKSLSFLDPSDLGTLESLAEQEDSVPSLGFSGFRKVFLE